VDEGALPSRLPQALKDADPFVNAMQVLKDTVPSLKPSQVLKEAVHGVAERTEKELILDALRQTVGNRTRAALILGVSRKTLFNKMTLLRIRWPE
jgi:DNA-binding NtrC family response regulator